MRFTTLFHAGLLAALTSPASAGTLTVTDLGDAGTGACQATCTLRDAIASAAPGDTIAFASTLSYPATITLNGQELLIYKDLLLVGPGARQLAIDGNSQSRLLEIAPNASAIVSGLALTNGQVAGVDGGFTSEPRARDGGDAYGGAVFVNAGASLQLSACWLIGNRATGGFGGRTSQSFGTQGSGGSGHGGAIYSEGSLMLNDTLLNSNYAWGGAPGGVLLGGNSGVQGNGGSAAGGAIEATGFTQITNSQFLSNALQAYFGGNGSGAGDAGGDGGSARGGAMAFSGFAYVSFVTSLGNTIGAGFGGSGDPNGASGVAVGADIYTRATLLSRSNVFISTSGATACSAGTIVAQGANFDADGSCQHFTLHGDAKLQGVNDGGATVALPLWGSPLIDAAIDCNDPFADPQTHDVRGVTRPLDGNADGTAACDLGAAESDALFANGFE